MVEIGASAGLNLLWDRYSYDYGEGRRYGALTSTVQISCTLRGNRLPPFPVFLPKVAWRMGIDLHPLGVSDPEAKLWKRFGPLHVYAPASEYILALKITAGRQKTLMIVLYYFRKHRSGHVNKLNSYWIGTYYQVGNRRMPKVSKTL